jgi:hypothetical protein
LTNLSEDSTSARTPGSTYSTCGRSPIADLTPKMLFNLDMSIPCSNVLGSVISMLKLLAATVTAEARFPNEPNSSVQWSQLPLDMLPTWTHTVLEVTILTCQPSFAFIRFIGGHANAITASRDADFESSLSIHIKQSMVLQILHDWT